MRWRSRGTGRIFPFALLVLVRCSAPASRVSKANPPQRARSLSLRCSSASRTRPITSRLVSSCVGSGQIRSGQSPTLQLTKPEREKQKEIAASKPTSCAHCIDRPRAQHPTLPSQSWLQAGPDPASRINQPHSPRAIEPVIVGGSHRHFSPLPTTEKPTTRMYRTRRRTSKGTYQSQATPPSVRPSARPLRPRQTSRAQGPGEGERVGRFLPPFRSARADGGGVGKLQLDRVGVGHPGIPGGGASEQTDFGGEGALQTAGKGGESGCLLFGKWMRCTLLEGAGRRVCWLR